ncbi:MAG: T9SS type A sorting domain-containing protein [Bacteroidetes bacterium]|nr:T9SS type A sorting domain-containing protein [Bacteroidota bacterium]
MIDRYLHRSIIILSLLSGCVRMYGQINNKQGSVVLNTDSFDLKKAEQDAINHGIRPTELRGYLNYKYSEYRSRFLPSISNHPAAMQRTSQVQSSYCPNMDFSNLNFTNWNGSYGTVTTGASTTTPAVYNVTQYNIVDPAGINADLIDTRNYHTIMNIPPTSAVYPYCLGYDSIACRIAGTQTISEIPFLNPSGGASSVRLNGALANYRACSLNYHLSLNPNNKFLSLGFAIIMENGGHPLNEQPYFQINLTDQNHNPIPGCPTYSYAANSITIVTDTLWKSSSIVYDAYYRPWQNIYIDMSAYPGVTDVNVEFLVQGCTLGGHYAYAYVSASCDMAGITSEFCPGTNTAILHAPSGYSSYQWADALGPISSTSGGTSPTLSVSPATAGQSYTCTLSSFGLPSVVMQTTLAVTTVSINNINTTFSCKGGHNGTAFAQAGGSNTGYTFTWTDSSGAVISTAALAQNLYPGHYLLTVTASNCGQDTQSVVIHEMPSATLVANNQVTMCGSKGMLIADPGSSYQWYYLPGLTNSPIPGPNGTNDTLILINPAYNQQYAVTYQSSTGCIDSSLYTIVPGIAGDIYTSDVKKTCSGQQLGSAIIHLVPAYTVPHDYTIIGPNNYNNTLSHTTALKDSIYGLVAGTYSITVTDSLCIYYSTFTIDSTLGVFNIIPAMPAICNGLPITLTADSQPGSNTSCGVSPNGTCNNTSLLTIGNGTITNTNSTWPTPYGNWYSNARHQFLFLASELQAAGFSAGKISSIAFMIQSVNGLTNYPNYSISMRCTLLDSLPAINQFETGLYQVYSVPNYAVQTGWNTHNFQQAYDWDGLSNLIVEVCYGQNPFSTSNYSYNSVCYQSPTPFVSSKVFFSDVDPACGPAVPGSFSWQTFSQRPNVKFGICAGSSNPANISYTWSPTTGLSNPTGSITVASPSVNTTYTVIGSTPAGCTYSTTTNLVISSGPTVTVNNGSVCIGSIYQINPSGASSYSYSSGSSSVLPSVNTTYTVTGYDIYHCADTALCHVTVLPVPTLSVTGYENSICPGETNTIHVSGANSYTWSTGSVGSNVIISPTVTTAYSVIGEDANGCTESSNFIQVVESCVGIHDIDASSEAIHIYPNPSTGIFIIEGLNSQSQSTLNVYNLLGELIVHNTINTPATVINLQELPSGIYTLCVQQQDKKTYYKSLVKQ